MYIYIYTLLVFNNNPSREACMMKAQNGVNLCDYNTSRFKIYHHLLAKKWPAALDSLATVSNKLQRPGGSSLNQDRPPMARQH